MNISEITGSYRTKLLITAYEKWIKREDTVLDIGCGTGIVTKILAKRLSVKITCADVKKYLLFSMPFIKIKNNKIPVKDKSFDIAMLNDVLHHIDKDQQLKILAEAIRVAKKVLVLEAEPTIVAKLTDVILNKCHYGDLNTPLSFRSVDNWGKTFKKLSLKSELVKLKKPFWYPFSHIAFLLTKK